MLRRIEGAGLGAVYAAARLAREVVWSVWRPALVGVRALVVREGEVLLVRHRSGRAPWALPGGGVNLHERLEEAARREAFEEAGVPARVERTLGVYDAFNGRYTNYIVVFVCAGLGAANPPRSLEIAEARYFRPDALPEAIDQGSRRRIAEWSAGKYGLSEIW